jgi:hypothetical protein
MSSQYRCDRCGTLFEGVRWEPDEPESGSVEPAS